jgi:hypothetical protein
MTIVLNITTSDMYSHCIMLLFMIFIYGKVNYIAYYSIIL